MNILVINGSPNGAQGNTEVLVQQFLAGAREAGASQTEVIYLKDKEVNSCIGCFTCWTKTPGVCVHQDDMPAILEKIRKADLIVCASPLYVYTVSGLMKDCMDRLIPIAQPFVEVKDGVCSHPARYKDAPKKYMLISNCGFPEQSHFNGLKETFRTWFRGNGKALVGMICCAAGPLLRVPMFQDDIKWYLEATKQAGIEVVKEGQISEQTQAILEKPLTPDTVAYATALNEHWRSLGVQPVE